MSSTYIIKSWDLVTRGASDPPKVTEEEIAMAEVFARGERAVAECRRLEGLVARYQQRCERLRADLDSCEAEKKGLQCQLEKVGADAAQGREQGYQQGRTDTLGYLRKVVLTLPTSFRMIVTWRPTSTT